MRTRQITLGLGVLALSLSATTAFAHDDDGWHRGHREEWREHRDDHADRYREAQERYTRDRARLEHERWEGDWREAEALRDRLHWEREELERLAWGYGWL